MISFATEHVISAERVCRDYDLSDDTFRKWCREGLEYIQRERKRYTSLEALDRFFGSVPRGASAKELDEALAACERGGIRTGSNNPRAR